ncbi:MAG TPA: hypothetical protein VGQ59_14135 [Cyclobacteriaceae bacterium]|nr:hypothetical protein [Cyclobacteriaceae bacterium]
MKKKELDSILTTLKDEYERHKAKGSVPRFVYGALLLEYELLRQPRRRSLYLGEGKALLNDEIAALSQTIFELSSATRFNREHEQYGSPDYTALFLVARSLVKTFLAYEHIFLLSTSLEDCIIRFQLWSEYGLTDKAIASTKKKSGTEKKYKLNIPAIEFITALCRRDPDHEKIDFPRFEKMLSGPFKEMKGWQGLLKESRLDYDLFHGIMRLLALYEEGGPTTIFLNNSSPNNYIVENPMQLDRVHLCMVIVKIINTHMCQKSPPWFSETEAPLWPHFSFSNESFDKAYDRWIKGKTLKKTNTILRG